LASHPCADCRVRSQCICRALVDDACGLPASDSAIEGRIRRRVRARHNICVAGDALNWVYVVHEGWAFRFAQLSDGRRQILSFILPGDVFTAMSVFKSKCQWSVQAITDVRLCGYSRGRLQESLRVDAGIFSAWTTLLVDQALETEQLLVDLGCRSAEERIAHLILNLRERMSRRGIKVGRSFPFPLSQRLIGEITGLTPEHVNRVMRSFRQQGLIETDSKKTMTILNLAEFRRIGELRA
jgi:CRP/FNR family transcriptional regulator